MRLLPALLAIAAAAAAFVVTVAALSMFSLPWEGVSSGREASAFTLVSVGGPQTAGTTTIASERVPTGGGDELLPALPGAPLLVGLQGLLTDNTGTPVSNGPHSVTFALYDEGSGGTLIWTESQSVTTVSGLFSTSLGGTTALTIANLTQSSDTWLQVQASPDPPMVPRLRLFSAPYAVVAAEAEGLTCTGCVGTADLASAAVDSAKLADGTVGAIDLAASAVTSTKIAAGAVTNAALGADAVTTDKIATAGVGVTDIADGAVTSAKILDGTISLADLADGAVTSAKILDGTITTADIADGTITSADLAAGSVGTSQIADGTVSTTDLAAGAVGTSDLASDSVTSDKVAFNYAGSTSEGGAAVSLDRPGHSVTAVDSSGSVGQFASIVIGEDGLPVVSYYDSTDSALNVLHCGNMACNSGNTITPVAGSSTVGVTSAIIGADGFPAVAYREGVSQDLKFAHCGNRTCTSGNSVVAVDSSGNIGDHASLTIGADGLPVMSYIDTGNFDLKVAHCSAADCAFGVTLSTIDTTGSVGSYSSIAIGVDGLPIISYADETNWDLKVVHCGNGQCSSGNTITAVDTAGIVGDYTSLTIGTDGLPIISYHDISATALNALKCSLLDCSSGNTITELDGAGSTGFWTAITIGGDGMPLVSYRDETDQELQVYHCANGACTSGSTVVVDTAVSAGRYSTATIGADGLPIIAYQDATNFDLRVVRCSNRFCVPYHRSR